MDKSKFVEMIIKMQLLPKFKQETIRIILSDMLGSEPKLIITRKPFSSYQNPYEFFGQNDNFIEFGIANKEMMFKLKEIYKDYILKEYDNGDIDYQIISAWQELEKSKKI